MNKTRTAKRRKLLNLQNETFGGPARGIKHSLSRPEGLNIPSTSTSSSMENSIAAQLQNVEVKFIPPLHEQRRAWVLDALRRESVTSVGL